MSIAQLSHRSLPTKRVSSRIPDITKRPQRPERTQISELYEYGNKGKLPVSTNLVAMDTISMSTEMLNQYNNLIASEESLAFKPLPAVKVSYQPTKNKFMEPNRNDKSSKIIRPHLTVKTHSPGHHIFTEGISKNSIIRSPTFALQKVGVPYSNLPDNISIHKEKDKFAFGVKTDEYEKSPYRLTPRPFKAGSATFVTKMESEHSSSNSNEKFLKSKSGGNRPLQRRPSLEIKSNVIKLKPLVNMDKEAKPEFGPDFIKVPAVPHAPMKPPLAPRNSVHEVNTGDIKMAVKIDNHPLPPPPTRVKQDNVRDRKLSVVSIGETIDPDFSNASKRETRQQYPMYDHKSRLNENFKKQLFEYSGNEPINSKSKYPSSTFTYKVSTRSMSFIQDNTPDRFKPIKNNLRDAQGNVIYKQRRHRIATSMEEIARSNSDYNFRKYYRRVFRRPKSSDSYSTDVTQIPGNPPPSEISHIFSEDGPIIINDGRNEMLTLIEERTMTASIMSPRKENSPKLSIRIGQFDAPPNTKQGDENEGLDTGRSPRTYLEELETCTDTDVQFEHALKAIDRVNSVETGMSMNLGSLDTTRFSKLDEEIVNSSMKQSETTNPEYTENVEVMNNESMNNQEQNAEQPVEQNEDGGKVSDDSAYSVNESSLKNGTSVLEYIAEGEQRVKERTMSAGSELSEKEKVIVDVQGKIDGLDTIDELMDISMDSKKTVLPKIKGAYKPLLPVPKLSLDSVENHPTLEIHKERTSLSRTLQSLNCENKHQPVASSDYSLKLDIEKSGETSLKKTHVPVTRLRLFSDTSSLSASENDKIYESLGLQVNIGVTSRSTDQQNIEKKLVNNANVPFIYPSMSEIKAKRQ